MKSPFPIRHPQSAIRIPYSARVGFFRAVAFAVVALIIWLWPSLCAHGAATNAPVIFDLGNILGSASTGRVMQVRPANGPFTWQGRLVTADPIKLITTASGLVTNNLLPALYLVEVQSPPAASRFYITVPETNGTLYASDLVETNLTTGTAAGTYSRSQVDALLTTLPASTNTVSPLQATNIALAEAQRVASTNTASLNTNAPVAFEDLGADVLRVGSAVVSNLIGAVLRITEPINVNAGGTGGSNHVVNTLLVGNGTSAIKGAIIGSGLSYDGTTLTAAGGSTGETVTLTNLLDLDEFWNQLASYTETNATSGGGISSNEVWTVANDAISTHWLANFDNYFVGGVETYGIATAGYADGVGSTAVQTSTNYTISSAASAWSAETARHEAVSNNVIAYVDLTKLPINNGTASNLTADKLDVPGIITSGRLVETNAFDWTKAITNGLVMSCWGRSGFTLVGTNISQWNDSSGYGNHLRMDASASQPVLMGSGDLAGPYWITYGGFNANAFLTNLTVSYNNTNHTFIYVFSLPRGSLGGVLWSSTGGTPATLLFEDGSHPSGSVYNTGPGYTTPNVQAGAGLNFLAVSSSSTRMLTLLNDQMATTTVLSGGAITGGALGNWANTFYHRGAIRAVLIYNRALEISEIETIRSGADNVYGLLPKKIQINCVGDSKTEGYYAFGDYNYPCLLARDSSRHVVNLGRSGSYCTTPTGWTNAALIGLVTGSSNSTVSKIVDIINVGSNDAVGGTSADIIWASHTNMAARFRAAGHKVINTQITYVGVVATDTIITNLNGLISSNWSTWFDAYVPFDGDSKVGLANSSANTTYWKDTIHENNAGYLYEAPFYEGALSRALSSAMAVTAPVNSGPTVTNGTYWVPMYVNGTNGWILFYY